MLIYNPKDWYWIVSADQSRVYSSKSADFVPVDNSVYVAWRERGGVATNIISEAELGAVLAPYALRPVSASVLDGYTESQAVKLTIEVVAKVLFNHENRVRVLEGKQPINANQFKTAIKALL